MSATDRRLCVVLHDVAPATWLACRSILDALADIGRFPTTLLAVPRFHHDQRDAAFEHWLRERAEAGDEVALHGFFHVDDAPPRGPIDRLRRRVYTRGEGEFCDIGFTEATRRIEAGRAWLAELGIAPAGFVAPAWLLGAEAWRALRAQPFDYTCTLRRIHLLPGARSVVCQSQVYSSSTAWRRYASIAWNSTLARWQRDAPLVRLELHPGDDVPLLRRSWRRLAKQQAATRRACTLKALAGYLRTAPAPTSP